MFQINNTISKQKSKTKTIKINFNSLAISIMIVVIMLLILIDPVTYAKSIIKGLTLYFKNVLPGLLPFMFFIKQLTNQNAIIKLTNKLKFIAKPFGVSYCGVYAFIMSLLSGYPIGSKITSDIYSGTIIDDDTLLKTAVFSSTPGLIFVIGSVGGLMLNNIKLGLAIYFINIFACIINNCSRCII